MATENMKYHQVYKKATKKKNKESKQQATISKKLKETRQADAFSALRRGWGKG